MISELTKYDEEDDNKEVFDDSVSQMVEPPEDFNTVQTYPVRGNQSLYDHRIYVTYLSFYMSEMYKLFELWKSIYTNVK